MGVLVTLLALYGTDSRKRRNEKRCFNRTNTTAITVTYCSIHVGCQDFSIDQLDDAFAEWSEENAVRGKAMIEIALFLGLFLVLLKYCVDR